MGVPRDDLLQMVRALKRGVADVKAIRKALDRQISKPISFLEALHLPAADADTLKADTTLPDSLKDKAHLDALFGVLAEGEHLSPPEWERFIASLSRTARAGYEGVQVPQNFDGYTLQWELARRERGVVYRAKDSEGRDVAIKVFRTGAPVEGSLPKVGEFHYSVSPFEDGETLESKKVSARRSVETIHRAADLLRQRDHGALSPARIVRRKDDTVAILGFEHARALPLSTRSQVYAGPTDAHALGAILYELLVGTPPAGETSPAKRNRDVEPDLDRVVSAALSGGYASSAEFADDLGRFLRGEPVTARKAAASAGGGGKSWVWIAAGVAAAVVLVLVFALKGGDEIPEEPEMPEARKPEPAAPAPKAEPKPEPKKTRPRPKVVDRKPLTEKEERALRQACEEAFGDESYEQVISAADEALTRGAKGDWPLYYLAQAYTERNELDMALEYVSRALERAPDNPEYLRMRAETHAYRGEVAKAVADLGQLYGKKHAEINREIITLGKQVEVDPGDARGQLLLGVFFYLKRHYEDAGRRFTAAVEGGRRRALHWRARARFGDEDREGARQDAEAFLREFPKDFASAEVRAFLTELK